MAACGTTMSGQRGAGLRRRNANGCTQLVDLPRHMISEHATDSDFLVVTKPLL